VRTEWLLERWIRSLSWMRTAVSQQRSQRWNQRSQQPQQKGRRSRRPPDGVV
jgi:hypothetical protein